MTGESISFDRLMKSEWREVCVCRQIRDQMYPTSEMVLLTVVSKCMTAIRFGSDAPHKRVLLFHCSKLRTGNFYVLFFGSYKVKASR